MRVPLGWLREYVDLPGDAGAVADRLAMLGFPVDAVESRPEISGVVVGKILTLEKHPNADRLQVAQIDVGRERPLTVATAATNVAAGQTIAVATIGAQLPQLTIEPRKMRGIASEGMMISAEELALPGECFEDGILQLEPDRVPGEDVVALFGLSGAVLDVEITSNRVDAMSMIGIARELAASYGAPLRLPSFDNPGTGQEPAGKAPDVAIETPDCTRFVLQRFDGIAAATAPAWMRIRLALAGQRPIDGIVDISNYVMLEIGQPLHFYDAAAIEDLRLIVRDARAGERLLTLDGVERILEPSALVIADRRGVLGLAGVMGGADSEVRATTTSIVLESANFSGARVRRTAKALALRSEASSRHEKSLAPALTNIGAARAAQLLCASGARAYAPRAFGNAVRPAPAIALRAVDVERLLGMTLTPERIAMQLTALGCSVANAGSNLSVTPPLWRNDLAIAADLVEEVARMEGYDRIEPVEPAVPAHVVSSVVFERESAAARALATLGYREIVGRTLHGAQPLEKAARAGLTFDPPVEVLNPLSDDQRYLRASLAEGLIEYFAAASQPVRIFEIGHVFARRDGAIAERNALAFGFSTEGREEPPWRDDAFLRLKGDSVALLRRLTGRLAETARGDAPGLHPGKTATLSVDDRPVATLGRLDPRIAQAFDVRHAAYLCFVDLEALPERVLPQYRVPSKFPGTARDVALVVGVDVAAREVERVVANAIGELCTGVAAFDEYRGPQVDPGRKSLALRVDLQRFDATITDREADEAIARAIEALRNEFEATVRS